MSRNSRVALYVEHTHHDDPRLIEDIDQVQQLVPCAVSAGRCARIAELPGRGCANSPGVAVVEKPVVSGRFAVPDERYPQRGQSDTGQCVGQ